MFCFADIGAWDIGRVFVHTLPEITAWVVGLAGLGLGLGILTLMVALRTLLPWSRLHQLRQHNRGWLWVGVQWSWVILWGLCLPLLGASIGGLTGSAIGARRLVQREHVGQVVGERLLGPVCTQLAHQLEVRYPEYGQLSTAELDPQVVPQVLDRITPQLVEQALAGVKMLDERDPSAGAVEQVARKYIRRGLHFAAQQFFREKTRFIRQLVSELEQRTGQQRKARLGDVVACASHLYFTPAFAEWTFWWVFAHGALLVPVMTAVLVLPPVLFAVYWWWRERSLKAECLSPAESAEQLPDPSTP